MKDLEELYQDLKKYSDFDKDNNTEKFLEASDQIINEGDPGSIKILMHYFDDDSEYNWVLESLKVNLDAFPGDVFAKAIIEEIPSLMERSPHWLLSIIYRIFNDPPSLSHFRKNMSLIPKQSMIQLLDLVAAESQAHRGICSELKKELLKN